MGLLNELNTINRTLENNQKQATKTQQKEHIKEKKERIQNIFKSHVDYLFTFTKNTKDVEKLTSNLIKNKWQNIEFVKSNYYDKYKEKLNQSDIDFICQYYYKFIQDVSKEYLYIYKLEKREQKEDERQEQIRQKALDKEWIKRQKEKQIIFNNIITTLKTITLILASPFILIMFFVWGICKNTK